MTIRLMGIEWAIWSPIPSIGIARVMTLLVRNGMAYEDAQAVIYLTNLVDSYEEWVKIFGFLPRRILASRAYASLTQAQLILNAQ